MAIDDEEDSNDGQSAEEKPKSKKKLFIIVGVVVFALLLAGGAAFLFLGGSEEKAGAGEEEAVEETLATAELPAFVVNLSQDSGFLKARILVEYYPDVVTSGRFASAIEVTDEFGRVQLPGVLGEREPMIQDAVILVLTSKSRQELLTADGKEALKEELLEAINDATGLDEEAVTGVYYLEFIIQ